MTVASVRLTEEEREFLERLIAEGRFSSISETLRAGVHELMAEERLKSLPWQTYAQVRRYFAGRRRQFRGLEADHVEEDGSPP